MNFMKDVSWIDELKIKAGYGVTGNQDAIGAYNTFLTLTTNGNTYNASITATHQHMVRTRTLTRICNGNNGLV